MAEIDKGLPNVRQEIKIPPKDEMAQVVEQLQESMPSPDKTEIRENEDKGSQDKTRRRQEKPSQEKTTQEGTRQSQTREDN